MDKKKIKAYAAAVAATEAVGALSGFITRDGMRLYTDEVVKPPFSPPPIVFPIAWAALYALMAIGAARVWLSPRSRARTRGLRLYAVQLAMNFLWSIVFFNLEYFGLALVWLAGLTALVVWMTVTWYKTDRAAAFLQTPYIVWLAFAAYLNAGVFVLNR